ncbi:hypothetical protein GCM10023322_45690 [Rugosimonospora acidiphila]|uniref:Uncharacterized protein n=1 Tax=Rugosimonospora acidiphila TaxID=556531 RepID=A0ABP9S3R5_9ACTN
MDQRDHARVTAPAESTRVPSMSTRIAWQFSRMGSTVPRIAPGRAVRRIGIRPEFVERAWLETNR